MPNFVFPQGSAMTGLYADISSVYRSVLSQTGVAAAATTTSDTQDRLSSTFIRSAYFVTKATQNGTLTIEQSEDGTTWNTLKSFGVVANVILETGWLLFDYQYFRIKFTNSGGSAANVTVYQLVSSSDRVSPQATRTADSDIIQPVDIQSRKSTLVAGHNATVITAGNNSTAPTSYIDVTSESRIKVQVSGSATVPHTISLLWSNDGSTYVVEEVIGISRATSSTIPVETAGNYVKIKITNNDSSSRTFTTNIIKSV